jgi:hypothetical protein
MELYYSPIARIEQYGLSADCPYKMIPDDCERDVPEKYERKDIDRSIHCTARPFCVSQVHVQTTHDETRTTSENNL